MTDLLELKKRKTTVDINGQTLDIVGLSLSQITDIIERFEKLDALGTKSVIEVIKAAGAAAAGAVIAAGVGKPKDDKYEKFASDLDLGTQVDLIDAILNITQPKGDGPLARALSELIGMLMPIEDIKAAIAAVASPNSSPSLQPASPASGAAPVKSGS